jgi:hypothetical protein
MSSPRLRICTVIWATMQSATMTTFSESRFLPRTIAPPWRSHRAQSDATVQSEHRSRFPSRSRANWTDGSRQKDIDEFQHRVTGASACISCAETTRNLFMKPRRCCLYRQYLAQRGSMGKRPLAYGASLRCHACCHKISLQNIEDCRLRHRLSRRFAWRVACMMRVPSSNSRITLRCPIL